MDMPNGKVTRRPASGRPAGHLQIVHLGRYFPYGRRAEPRLNRVWVVVEQARHYPHSTPVTPCGDCPDHDLPKALRSLCAITCAAFKAQN